MAFCMQAGWACAPPQTSRSGATGAMKKITKVTNVTTRKRSAAHRTRLTRYRNTSLSSAASAVRRKQYLQPQRLARRNMRGSGGRDGRELRAGGVVAGEEVEEHEPVAEEARHQEVAAHVLLASESSLPCRGRVGEDLETGIGARLRRLGIHEP